MKIQKLILAFSLSLFFVLSAQAQDKPSPAETAEGEAEGRTIWGDLVPYGKIWRAGANDATTFTTSKDITVEGQKLAAGTYSFFVIPGESTSTFVFNKVAKQWGTYTYDEKQDVLRVNVASQQSSTMAERLVYEVKGDSFEIRWEYGKAAAKIGA
jgi:hypothetical protein